MIVWSVEIYMIIYQDGMVSVRVCTCVINQALDIKMAWLVSEFVHVLLTRL